MKRLTGFIVNKRNIIFSAMLILTAVCAFLIPKVSVNSDMTKYLPDDSSMKQGISLMEKEFPTMGESYTIRVMFKSLSSEKKTELKDALAAIENVDGVTYDMDSGDYNSGEYTLYILNTKYGYDTREEAAVEKQIKEKFSDYEVTVKNDDASAPDIPLSVYLAAFGIILVVLLISCGSYFEPILFLVTIGIAVVLNLGTNFFLGEISDVSFGIAAVLQLALSMDYSIILMNRYRQELKKTDDRKEAMENALRAAFGSITGSAVTTIVGLLVLVFMSFKIGADIGIVLA
ncbi:MAG: MMPL family transporter, partial [Lachnospiraceae bacterium]